MNAQLCLIKCDFACGSPWEEAMVNTELQAKLVSTALNKFESFKFALQMLISNNVGSICQLNL